MNYRGKRILGVSRPSYKFILLLDDGSQVEIEPNDLPRHTYKFLYSKMNETRISKGINSKHMS